jgi:hypothetical protein
MLETYKKEKKKVCSKGPSRKNICPEKSQINKFTWQYCQTLRWIGHTTYTLTISDVESMFEIDTKMIFPNRLHTPCHVCDTQYTRNTAPSQYNPQTEGFELFTVCSLLGMEGEKSWKSQ